MPSIGTVTRQKDGSFKGQLRTLSIRTMIEIIPNRSKSADNQPDFRVVADGNVEIGAGWNRIGEASGKPYVSLVLSAPEFGRLFANLGVAAGQDDPDVFAVIWNANE